MNDHDGRRVGDQASCRPSRCSRTRATVQTPTQWTTATTNGCGGIVVVVVVIVVVVAMATVSYAAQHAPLDEEQARDPVDDMAARAQEAEVGHRLAVADETVRSTDTAPARRTNNRLSWREQHPICR